MTDQLGQVVVGPLSAAMSSEEELIEAVMALRLEAGGASLTAAELHSKLEAKNVSASISEVKKAASKASKRAPKVVEAAPAAAQEAAPAAVSKSQAKAAKVFEQKMKAAEAAMMEEQKRLRDRWINDGTGKAPPHEGKAFIQFVTGRALAGALEPEEELCKERVEADVATLEWMILADQAGELQLPKEGREGAHNQLERLKTVRGSHKEDTRTLDAAREFYVVAPSSLQLVDPAATAPAVDTYDPSLKPISNFKEFGNLDKEIARAGMLTASKTASAMDEMD